MANGDIAHADIEQFIKLGRPFPATSSTGMTEDDADIICEDINAEVNLVLRRLGFSLPLSNATNITWVSNTKKLGASSLILDGMMAQDVDEGNTRAGRYWNRYIARLTDLVNSGGDLLDPSDKQTDPRPNNAPYLAGESTEEGMKRFLRFPQRAAADQYTDELAIRESGAGWLSAIGGL